MNNIENTRSAEIAKAREVDTRIAAVWERYHTEADKIRSLNKQLKEAAKSMRYPHNFNRPGRIEEITTKMDGIETAIATIEIVASTIREEARALEAAEYEGWSRFFLVKHIHSSTHCSSFRPTTRIGWLPDVSGLTEAEAVAAHGAILCTICFPSAPVEWTQGTQDPNVCSGSGKPIDWSLPNRRGYYSGNWATCSECGDRRGVSGSAHNIPKHKRV